MRHTVSANKVEEIDKDSWYQPWNYTHTHRVTCIWTSMHSCIHYTDIKYTEISEGTMMVLTKKMQLYYQESLLVGVREKERKR